MNISVEREASFEVSRRSNLSVEREASFEVPNRKMKRHDAEDGIIKTPVGTETYVSSRQNTPKKSTVGKTNSPTKVMDFIDGFTDKFSTPTKTHDDQNLSADSFDPWGDVEPKSADAKIDFTPFDPPSTSDDDSSPKKVLFAEETESKENSMVEDNGEVKQIGNVDENGFPNTSNPSDLYSASVMPAEFLEKKKHEKSRLMRFLQRIPEGTRVRAMKIQRQLMACQGQGATSVVVFDDGVDTSNIGDKPKPTSGTESVFTFDSLKHFSASLITGGQSMCALAMTSTQEQAQTDEKSSANLNKSSDSGKEASDSVVKLYIDLYEKSAFESLMQNLNGNNQVKELHVFRSWEQEGKCDRARTKEDIELLFKTVGSLSSLQVLSLANFLAVDLHYVSLNEWKNEKLKTIRIHVCKGALSKRLLSVLARLPALQDLTLEMNDSFPFHILLHSTTLESLTIVKNGFDIDNLHAMEIIQEIPKNETLKKLTIEPPMRPRTFKLLLSALSKNIGIEEFNFALLPGPEADINRVMQELARTLMSNGSLKSVRNVNYEKIDVEDDRTCDALMKALSKNYIIEDFLVFDEEPWFRDRKNRILKENKMEYDSVFPLLFKCGKDDEGNSKNVSANDSFASTGSSVAEHAQRVASGTLDFVAKAAGLQ